MKKIIAALFVIAILITVLIIANNNNKIPNGWFPAGSNPSEYEMGIDNSIFQNGQACAYIKSKSPKENQFGTRLMLSGYIKSENVKGRSGMWMRIDGESNQQVGFDNMYDRAIKGTTEWKKCEIVLDIPSNSLTINYGVLLNGDGQVWFDNFELKEVDKTVPLTNLKKENKIPSQPVNLDFENN
jgi:hypothetical protein